MICNFFNQTTWCSVIIIEKATQRYKDKNFCFLYIFSLLGCHSLFHVTYNPEDINNALSHFAVHTSIWTPTRFLFHEKEKEKKTFSRSRTYVERFITRCEKLLFISILFYFFFVFRLLVFGRCDYNGDTGGKRWGGGGRTSGVDPDQDQDGLRIPRFHHHRQRYAYGLQAKQGPRYALSFRLSFLFTSRRQKNWLEFH